MTTAYARLVPNSTTRTPATDMLYNTTNGRAHNNSATCCTTNSPPTDKNLPHPNILRCWALALRCGKFVVVVQQDVELLSACPLVLLYNMSVAGVRVVEFGTYPVHIPTPAVGYDVASRSSNVASFACTAADTFWAFNLRTTLDLVTKQKALALTVANWTPEPREYWVTNVRDFYTVIIPYYYVTNRNRSAIIATLPVSWYVFKAVCTRSAMQLEYDCSTRIFFLVLQLYCTCADCLTVFYLTIATNGLSVLNRFSQRK